MTGHPYDAIGLPDLRERTSVKWRAYGPDVLPLWVAEMDFPLAEPIRRALHELVDRGDTGYAVGAPLAEAFAGFAARRYDWRLDPDLAWACPDVMSGVEYALRALTEPGDGVAFLTPAYPPFFGSVGWAGRRVVQVPLGAGNALDADRLDAALAHEASAILLCNPHNPTGRRFSRAELAAVAEVADRHGAPVICDEIHAPLVLDRAAGEHVPFATLDAEAARRCVCLHSASKGWNLAGLKAALLVAGSPETADRLRSPELEHLDLMSGIAGVAAGVAAFEHGEAWLDDTVGYLAGNHRLVHAELPAALPGVRIAPAEATYLAWLDLRDVPALGAAPDPAGVLLDRARVALSPGVQFGSPYAGWARMNLGTSRPVLREAIARLGDVAGSCRGG